MPNAFTPLGTRTPAEDYRRNSRDKTQCDDKAGGAIGKAHRPHDLWYPQVDAVTGSIEGRIGNTKRDYPRVTQGGPKIWSSAWLLCGKARCDGVLFSACEPFGIRWSIG